ncbi:conjugal transfer protein TraO [Flavobacterium plurextorum]|uniref:conjugal transfer protein TraO n=1 Tax=Flavobacterium TaxID=237 RepID=UPI00214DB69F|nr:MULTISPECIES: conjugal transfer protein TraO [Flavobacterium]UUW07877.1 conjugal transfer protein TraO [Flavobacterium plurextorum]
MKKTKLFLGVLLLSAFTKGYSQTYKNAFGVGIGATQDGYGVMFSHNYFINDRNSISASILATDAKYKVGEDKIGYNDITLNLGYSVPLYLTQNRKFGIVFGSGVVLGYEIVNGNKNLNLSNGSLILDESKFIYGAYVGLDFDYLINDRTTLFIKVNEYYHANSDLGKFVPFAGIGLRYYTN